MEFSVYIAGNFLNHYDGMRKKIGEFERNGFVVLSPQTAVVTSSVDPAVIKCRYDQRLARLIRNEGAMEMDRAIRKSDALFVYNPDRSIDPVVSLQLGLALGYKKPIFSECAIPEEGIGQYCTVIRSDQPYKVKAGILRNNIKQRVLTAFG